MAIESPEQTPDPKMNEIKGICDIIVSEIKELNAIRKRYGKNLLVINYRKLGIELIIKGKKKTDADKLNNDH